MAITGIDTIEGKQIIAAGAVSAKSAEMAYNDENGNPITGYQIAGDYYSASNPSGFITGVPDTYLQNTDLTISDNKVTEISGIPLSAGTELEFEYDAADNISAINNSAISTTPSQALYAQNPLYFSATGASSYMGINSADLARMLGVDETVLFESANAVTNAPLSESMTAFNRVRVSLANDFTDTGLYQTVIDLDVEHGSHIWEPVGGLGTTNMWVGVNMLSANTDYTILTAPKAKLINFGNWTTQGTAIVGSTTGANVNVILKVIGIGRKEV